MGAAGARGRQLRCSPAVSASREVSLRRATAGQSPSFPGQSVFLPSLPQPACLPAFPRSPVPAQLLSKQVVPQAPQERGQAGLFLLPQARGRCSRALSLTSPLAEARSGRLAPALLPESAALPRGGLGWAGRGDESCLQPARRPPPRPIPRAGSLQPCPVLSRRGAFSRPTWRGPSGLLHASLAERRGGGGKGVKGYSAGKRRTAAPRFFFMLQDWAGLANKSPTGLLPTPDPLGDACSPFPHCLLRRMEPGCRTLQAKPRRTLLRGRTLSFLGTWFLGQRPS